MSSGGVVPIRPRERDAIIQALSAGVVPRMGLKFVQVGRLREVQSMQVGG